MDHADQLEILVTGSVDMASRRAHHQMQSDEELPVAEPEVDEALVRFGFILGGPASRNKFRKAVLPTGWTIKPSGHHMYSHVLDEKGRRRVQIGYSRQDVWTSLVLERRFRASSVKDDGGDSFVIPVIQDSDRRSLWRGFSVPEVDRKVDPLWFDKPTASSLADMLAAGKLSMLAPQHASPEAYWGVDGDAIVWPPHNTPPDTRESYRVVTACYRGRHQEDGGEHASCRSKSDDEATKNLLDKMSGLASFYDEVRWTIWCGDRQVANGVAHKPMRFELPYEMRGLMNGEGL